MTLARFESRYFCKYDRRRLLDHRGVWDDSTVSVARIGDSHEGEPLM